MNANFFFGIAQWGASLILNSTDFIESCISRRLNLEGRSRFEKLETEMRFVKPLKSLQKGQNVDESANFVEKSFFFFEILPHHPTTLHCKKKSNSYLSQILFRYINHILKKK